MTEIFLKEKIKIKRIIILGFLFFVSAFLSFQLVFAQGTIRSPQYKIEDSYIEIQKNSGSQEISLTKKENDKEKVVGKVKIVDQYLISDIPENEFLEKYSYLNEGFKDLKIEIEIDQPFFKKENFYHSKSLFQKMESLFFGNELPDYRLTKEVSNATEGLETNFRTPGLNFKTSYKKGRQGAFSNGGEEVKQNLVLTNNSEKDLNLSLLLKNRIDAETIQWNNHIYLISEDPQKFGNPTKVSFYSHNMGYLSSFDFSDIPEEFLPELWVEKENSQSFLILSLNVFIPAHSSKTIDPQYQSQITPQAIKAEKNGDSAVYKLKLDGDVVEIGTKERSPSRPYLKLNRWGDETSLIVFSPYITEKEAIFSENENMVKWIDKDWEFHFYPLEPREVKEEEFTFIQNENGGMEFEVILKEKPVSNVIEFTIETKGLDFFYQPSLTQEFKNGYSEEFQKEIVVSETQVKDLEGNVLVNRPENVVGSYAVYTSEQKINWTGGKLYGTGQFGFIYRPKIIDSANKETWGILNVDNEILSIEIPQDFLDKAVYPIIIDPNFGYQTVGGTGLSLAGGTARGGEDSYSPASNGTVNSVSFYCATDTVAAVAKGAVYDTSGNRAAYHDTNTGTVPTSANWVTITMDNGSVSSTTAYYIMAKTSLGVIWYYNAGTAVSKYFTNAFTTGFPATTTFTNGSARKYSIYATYTLGQGEGWYNTSWLYRQKITIDRTKVADNLTDFPVLVSTTSSNLSSKAQYDGDDILFTSSDGTTKLSHEIEQYASSTGEIWAWVKTDLSSIIDTVLYMYYGNAGASNQQQATSVWTNNYDAVYHMLGNGTDDALDSTQYDRDADAATRNMLGTTSQIYQGRQTDNNTEYFYDANDGGAEPQNGPYTYSFWIKSQQGTAAGTPLTKYTDGVGGVFLNSYDESYCYVVDSDLDERYEYWDAEVEDGSWHFVACIINRDNNRLELWYDDGLDTTYEDISVIGTIDSNAPFIFGYLNTTTFDEIRLSPVRRSNAWLSTEYNNQTSTAAFESFGTEEANNAAPTLGTIILNGSNNINLTENTTTTVLATATVSDTGGYTTIASVEGKIYRSGVGSSCSNNDNNCYSDSVCATSSCSDNSCTATCEYNVWFHADPTDAGDYSSQYWEAWIKAIDTDNASSTATSTSVEMNTLRASDLSTSTINYGGLNVGEDTGTLNQNQTVTNTGNESIDFYLYGTDLASTSGSWYDSDWGYRKEIIITAGTAATSNYQIKFTVAASSSYSGDFNLDGHAGNFPGDIRWTDNNGTTLLDYWEEATTTATTSMWVEIADDLTGFTTTSIYIYYGNASANSVSNGSSTFIFFDDFSGASLDTDKWLTYNVDSTSQSGGILTASTTNKDPNKIIADVNDTGQTGDNVAMRARYRITGGSGADQRIGLGVKTSTSTGQGLNYVLHDFVNKNKHHFLDDALAWGTDNGGSFAINTWYIEEIYYNGTAVVGRFDDGTWYSWTRGGRSGYMALNTGGYQEAVSNEWDFALIRKIVATEPAFSSAGSGESIFFIPVGNQEWSTSSGVSYGSGTDATSSTSNAVEVDLTKPTSHPSTSTQGVYWGIAIPAGTSYGTYNGSHTYEAKSD